MVESTLTVDKVEIPLTISSVQDMLVLQQWTTGNCFVKISALKLENTTFQTLRIQCLDTAVRFIIRSIVYLKFVTQWIPLLHTVEQKNPPNHYNI